MLEQTPVPSFECLVLPHLDAAYNLARWLTRNDQDAQDVVQDAYLRALRFFEGFRGGDARPWLLKIVRNTSYSFLEKNRPARLAEEFDEQVHVAEGGAPDVETEMVRRVDQGTVREALEELPLHLREILVLREVEELSYKEIAELVNIPIGTVMSSLSRARQRLSQSPLIFKNQQARAGCARNSRGALSR
jgi:RNA polymerase sigma factor (sigma-70 family)